MPQKKRVFGLRSKYLIFEQAKNNEEKQIAGHNDQGNDTKIAFVPGGLVPEVVKKVVRNPINPQRRKLGEHRRYSQKHINQADLFLGKNTRVQNGNVNAPKYHPQIREK